MGGHQNNALLDALRSALRHQNLSHADIADKIGASTASVKRWLSGRGLTLDRLSSLCAIAGLDLTDLVDLAREQSERQIWQLTLAQERGLADDGALAFFFFALLNGWPASDFAADFAVSEAGMTHYCERLVRLGLIRLLPGGRIKPLANRRVTWRRGGPLSRHFQSHIKQLFFDMDFGAADTHYLSDIAKLSDRGIQRLDALTSDFRRSLHEIAEEDRHLGSADRHWIAMMVVSRTLDLSDLPFTVPARDEKQDEAQQMT